MNDAKVVDKQQPILVALLKELEFTNDNTNELCNKLQDRLNVLNSKPERKIEEVNKGKEEPINTAIDKFRFELSRKNNINIKLTYILNDLEEII